MTVAELIEKLKEYPQDLPVVAINGVESIGFVNTSITVKDPKDPYHEGVREIGKKYNGPYLFLAGY